MTAEKEPRFLKRYISIKRLFDILNAKCLFLSDPARWEDYDKNDCAALRAFCRLKGKGIKARVLCFAEGEEVVHHWNAYSNSEDSCYIEFNDEILNEFNGTNIIPGFIEYKPIKDIKKAYLEKLIADKKIDAIPFIKRRPYECDKEYRVIWFGTNKIPEGIPLKKSTIKRITLSPKIPDCVRKEYKSKIENKLKEKFGENKIGVELSRIMESEELIRLFDQLGKKK